MPAVVLVVTTVHPADDPRVRRRTVGVLAVAMPVRYAAREPAPADTCGFEWVPLRGGRMLRALAALRQMLRRDVGVVSIHDPELLPFALVARLAGRRVVVDVHEDVPAQIRDKDWLPRLLRPLLATGAALLLRGAERFVTVTLAEDSYARLFRGAHPVLPNHPLVDDLPPVGGDGGNGGAHGDGDGGDGGPVVYVGDITAARGAEIAVRAVSGMQPGRTLEMIGRCREPLRSRLRTLAHALDVDLRLMGFLPHPVAMRRVADAAVGISPLLGLPNHRDSLPTKVIEYLAVGVPVVASDLPGTRRVVGALPGVRLVPPGDAAAWTAALQEAVTDPALRRGARSGADDVRRRFTWRSKEVQGLYQGLLMRGGVTGSA